MDIRFHSRKTAKLFGSEAELRKKYGAQCAKKIMLRLVQIETADNLDELRGAPGRYHELTGDRKGQLAVDLPGPYRLVFEPSDPDECRKSDGGLDWRLVIAVFILEVVDYH